MREAWPDLVETCGVLQPSLQRDLRDSWPLELTDTCLTIGFDPEFSRVLDEVRMLDHRGLHRLFSREVGRELRIDYKIMSRPVTWSHTTPQPSPTTGEEKPFDIATAGDNPQEWMRNDSIKQIMEIFHGDIIDIQR